ncbi:MAG: peptidylprolyl isomerase [Armatimonadetes bacterium]|nr:peptidylprolyl isomerase [Armatimonadota bacterium]
MANSQRVGAKDGKKGQASATIRKKRERRPVSHTSSLGSLTVLRHQMQNMRVTRWNFNLAQILFILLGIVMVLGIGVSLPNVRRDPVSGSGDVARVGKHAIERQAFELTVGRTKDSPYAMFMGGSGPTQELAIRNMVLDQQMDHLLKLDAARREGNRVGRKQLANRIEQAVDAEIQRAKAQFKTEKAFQETFLKKRQKVANEEELRRKLRGEIRRDQAWIKAVREQILIENLESKIRRQAAALPIDKVKPEDLEVRVRQILIKTEKRSDAAAKKLAGKVLEMVKSGADFAKIAKEQSEDDYTKAKGGDMGWLAKGAFWQGPEVEKAALALKPGQISGLVKGSAGYHILKVDDRRYSATKHWNEYVDGLKKKSPMNVADPAIRAYRLSTAEAKDEAARKKNRQQAIAMFQEAVGGTYDPDLRAAVHHQIGALYAQDGNPTKAAEHYGRATDARPAPALYMALGDAQRQLKKNAAAVRSYVNASEMASDKSSQQDYFTHMMLQSTFTQLKETKLAAAEKAWIDDYLKNQPAGGMGFPGGMFTVP